jgi:hypothetical protein
MTHKPRLKPAAHRRVTPRVNAEYIGPAALVPTAVAAMLLLFGLFFRRLRGAHDHQQCRRANSAAG